MGNESPKEDIQTWSSVYCESTPSEGCILIILGDDWLYGKCYP